MKNTLRISLTSVAFAASTISAGAATFSFDLIDLGTISPNGTFGHGYDVNDSGQVTGRASGGNGGFFWSDGIMTNLGDVPGGSSYAYGQGINNSGQVVGYGGSDTGADAFVWENGTLTALPDLERGDLPQSTTWATAEDINDSGQIVGRSGAYAVIWENGEARALASDPNFGGLGMANAINDLGQITGRTSGEVAQRGVIWDNDTMIDLGPTAGNPGLSQGFGINNLGQVAGIGSFDGRSYSMLWDQGAVSLLATYDEGFTQSRAQDINDNGFVVGYGNFLETTGFAPNRGFIWDAENGTQLLSDLIDPDLGWEIGIALGINEGGQITGWGTNELGQTRAYLLTPDSPLLPAPVPLPAGLPLLMAALAALAGLRRARMRHAA